MWTSAKACSGGCARVPMERDGYRCGVRGESISFIDCWRRICAERGERGRRQFNRSASMLRPSTAIAGVNGGVRRADAYSLPASAFTESWPGPYRGARRRLGFGWRWVRVRDRRGAWFCGRPVDGVGRHGDRGRWRSCTSPRGSEHARRFEGLGSGDLGGAGWEQAGFQHGMRPN